ncbi:MAG: tetraacyldisaccharide 4'-kinase, partial [Bacteroidales bacterium]|nr:tetraacyldisaccharide 4'-kinase [Bacteroidales bacterium]
GKTLAESRIGASTGLIILALVRFGRSETLPSRQTVLRAGDQILVQGRIDQFKELQRLSGLVIEREAPVLKSMVSSRIAYAEVRLADGSPLVSQLVGHAGFRSRFNVSVVGIHRRDTYRLTNLAYVPIRAGDQILVQGETEQIADLEKFEDLYVAVSEKRNAGMRQLLALEPPPEVVLLDDAFQHRWIMPGLSILLTDYHSLYTRDYMLPSGYLREPRSSAKRADIIIVTKTPEIFSPIIRRNLAEELKPASDQALFFSHITYDAPVPLTTMAQGLDLKDVHTVFLLAGIANPYPLEEHLKRSVDDVVTLKFPDHHNYSENELQTIVIRFRDHLVRKKLLLTTEKDAMRLRQSNLLSLLQEIPVAYIPIRVSFHGDDGQEFDQRILSYVEQNK